MLCLSLNAERVSRDDLLNINSQTFKYTIAPAVVCASRSIRKMAALKEQICTQVLP